MLLAFMSVVCSQVFVSAKFWELVFFQHMRFSFQSVAFEVVDAKLRRSTAEPPQSSECAHPTSEHNGSGGPCRKCPRLFGASLRKRS